MCRGGSVARDDAQGSTVSISMLFAGSCGEEASAGARVIGQAGTSFACEAEAWGSNGLTVVTGLVCYRITTAKA